MAVPTTRKASAGPPADVGSALAIHQGVDLVSILGATASRATGRTEAHGGPFL